MQERKRTKNRADVVVEEGGDGDLSQDRAVGHGETGRTWRDRKEQGDG